jgi:tetratricopeptide (TPR) repeat protein
MRNREDRRNAGADQTSPRLLAAAREKRLVVFAGAGISMAPPTALPSWWDLSGSVVRSIAARAANVVADSASLAELVVDRQNSDRFPPDYVAEKIVHSIGAAYFEVLRCIDSDRPNANHLALAELAAAGRLRVMITTNFDRTIEAACAARGVPLDVRADPQAAGDLLARWKEFESGALPCQLIKIHGTADRPDTIIDTLAQRARGTPAAYLECVQRLLALGAWGFIGFSGADLETRPDYLGLARGAAKGRGFTWLVQAGQQPRAAVQRLVDGWRGKAEIIAGSLPGFLLTLLDGATPLQPSPEKTVPLDVAGAARRWAQDIPERRCALIIAELVDGSGETARARAALEQLAATYPQHGWKLMSGWSGETLVLKADDDAGTPPGQPLGFGDPAKPTVAGLAPNLDQAPADRQNYADTLYGLADVLARLGEAEAAATVGTRSILAGLYAGGRTRVVRGLGVLADLRAEQRAQAAHEEADRLYAIAINAATPGSLIRANLLTNRGRNALRLDRKKAAFGTFMEALQSFAALGDERGRAGVALALAELSARVGDHHHALLFWNGVLEFAQRVGDDPMCFEASIGIGRVYLARGDRDRAGSTLAEALRAAKALNDPDREETARRAMASAAPPAG